MITIYEKIGEGSYGTVHRAVHHGVDYAIKFMEMDSLDVLIRDVLVLRYLQDKSNHVPTLYGFGIFEDGQVFLLMELCDKLRRYGNSELFNILKQVSEAVDSLHSHGIAHRDIVPNNIMLRPDGTVCLIDFGLATFVGDKPCRNLFTTRVTTLTSRPPELIDQPENMHYDPRNLDIWSTACATLYLAGYKTYKEHPKTEYYHMHILEPLQQVMQNLGKFNRMLSNDTDSRPSMATVVKDLEFVKAHRLEYRLPQEKSYKGEDKTLLLHNSDTFSKCTRHQSYEKELMSAFGSYLNGHRECVFNRATKIAESACNHQCRSVAAAALVISWSLHCRLHDSILQALAKWCNENSVYFEELICRVLVRMSIDMLGHCINGSDSN